MITQALKYAAKGKKIFPCSRDKKPLTSHGLKDASGQEDQIKAWWTETPDASIGFPTGPDSGVFVLDMDMPEGPSSLDALESVIGVLPTTLTQQTGGGGKQFFFAYPDNVTIQNSAGKLGPGLDVRGKGGYVIMPPSGHPSGGQYKWLNKAPIVPAPQALIDLITAKRERTNPVCTGSTTPYGAAALSNAIQTLVTSSNGTRNSTLNAVAYSLGRLIAGGELDHGQTVAGLLAAAISAGLSEKEASGTIASGIQSGMKEPKFVERSFSGQSGQSGQSSQSGQERTKKTAADSQRTASGQSGQLLQGRFVGNLALEIEEWVFNSPGSFTIQDVYREFGLSDRQDRKNASTYLDRLSKRKTIRKDLRVKGKFHANDLSVEWVDLEKDEDSFFSLSLPLGLDQMVTLPPKAIIVLAGATNSGKTALLLNVARMNRGKFPMLYVMSEMGTQEYKSRLKLFGDSLEEWKTVQAAVRTYGQDVLIQQHNPDGLTLVDFLEEVDGEYYKISSSIRSMYDALGNGIALVALQKRKHQEYGRGGEATAEKARLYLAMDNLAHTPDNTICSMKIIKCKSYQGRNPNGLECLFTLTRGHRIRQETEWLWMDEKKRDQLLALLKRRYDVPEKPVEADPFIPF